ncbi:MAG: thioredoxin family protein [Cumulibacter sp.]
MSAAIDLPDGLVVIVKKECATCQLIEPVLQDIKGRDGVELTVYTQDDLNFPADVDPRDDTELEVSWKLDIETVPTVIRVENGAEVERTFGWVREQWEKVTGLSDLGSDLPGFRPGCGSMSVDPDKVDALRVKYEGGLLHARRIELAEQEDEFEALFMRGWTDGLPVVPPTEERVMRMLSGTTRDPQDIVANIPPDLIDATVEKVAIAAVMAGCLPEYLPWVLTAVEAICNDEFNIHGVLATTMPVGPVIVCSGPGTETIGMNSGGNALGQGNRANMTIGRAVQLVVRNIGNGRPGGVDRANLGNPGKLSFCFAERPDSPFGSLAQARGVEAGVDALTVFAGEGPRCIVDQKSRTADELANSIAACMRTVHHPKAVQGFDAILVLSPEHGARFEDAGWSYEKIVQELRDRLDIPSEELLVGVGGNAEGLPPAMTGKVINKFAPGGLMIAYAGGTAGLFSAVIGGWARGAMGSTPVTREVVA